jgi:hypothetical protein
MLRDGSRINRKKELIKRLTHIQHLAEEENYAEIERLLQENYV